ncbi:MAG: hypothetical protein WD847_16610 [Pirellulales bacterium]
MTPPFQFRLRTMFWLVLVAAVICVAGLPLGRMLFFPLFID